MWRQFKEFFSFSKKDLRGIYLLLTTLLILLSIKFAMPLFIVQAEPDFNEFERMVMALEKADRAMKEVQEREEIDFNQPDAEIARIKLNPFPFDPNKLDEETGRKLGLSLRQIRNIQNYTASGGVFRKNEDFGRIFSITEEEYKALEPFIRITPAEKVSETLAHSGGEDTAAESVRPAARTVQKVNINTADSLDLIRVRGIGPVFARRIMRYREALGGFHSAEQLLEVYGLDSLRYQQIAGSFEFNRDEIQRIDINLAGVDDLKQHPYIDFYLAKSIVDQRIRKEKYSSSAELYDVPLMHDVLYRKLIPYFLIPE
jgi:competence protein ComEA